MKILFFLDSSNIQFINSNQNTFKIRLQYFNLADWEVKEEIWESSIWAFYWVTLETLATLRCLEVWREIQILAVA